MRQLSFLFIACACALGACSGGSDGTSGPGAGGGGVGGTQGSGAGATTGGGGQGPGGSGGGGVTVLSTRFESNAASWLVPASGNASGFFATAFDAGGSYWATFDLDGDGKPDLVQTADPQKSATVFGAGTTNAHWQVFLNTGTRFAAQASSWSVPSSGSASGFFASAFFAGGSYWSTYDIDGDGKPDLVQTADPQQSATVFGAGTASAHWQVFLNTGSGFRAQSTTWSVPSSGNASGFFASGFAAGGSYWSTFDIDGDGKPDLVQTADPQQSATVFGAGTPSAHWRVFLNTGSGFRAQATNWSVPSSGNASGFFANAFFAGGSYWTTFDIDGDGKPDLVQTADPQQSATVFGAGTPSAHWQVFLNTGSGFASQPTAWSVPSSGNAAGFFSSAFSAGGSYWSTFDIDGDRKPDLVQTADPQQSATVFGAGTPSAHWQVFLNQGGGFASQPVAWPVPSSGNASGFFSSAFFAGGSYWSTFDIDGDRRVDIVQTADPQQSATVFGAGTPSAHWQVFRGVP